LTKTDIADKIREVCQLEKQEILFVIDHFLEGIRDYVDKGEKVEIRGFGTFSREIRKSRVVYSPIAKKKLDVPARSVLCFKASKQTEYKNEGA
jgi:nucleoid DNA-binding protein